MLTSLDQVETIGDGYMISAGCPLDTTHNAIRAAETALDMLDAMEMVLPQDQTFQRSLENSNAETIAL